MIEQGGRTRTGPQIEDQCLQIQLGAHSTSVPFLWLLFPFSRRFRLYDHPVFVTYSLSFMTLLVVAGVLTARPAHLGRGFAIFIPPIHMYRQLRGTMLSRFRLWRTMAFNLASRRWLSSSSYWSARPVD
jgi:hypothetical protein